MKRLLRRFVSTLNGKKKYIFFVALVLICVLSLSVGIYAQFFYKYADTDPFMMGINDGIKKTTEEYAILENNFNQLFENSLKTNSENISVEKIYTEKDVVYTGYNLVNEDETFYNVDAKIPIINIDTDVVNEMNLEIRNEYYNKANSIMRQTQGKSVYKVSYAAYMNSDVLSLVIKASLKEEGMSEKVTIKTYTYSILKDEMLDLEQLIDVKHTTKEKVQDNIHTEIKTAYKNAQIIAAEYGKIYERDLKSEIYKVENAENYFLTDDGYVYVIYAYGNNDYTNEMDIVIF